MPEEKKELTKEEKAAKAEEYRKELENMSDEELDKVAGDVSGPVSTPKKCCLYALFNKTICE